MYSTPDKSFQLVQTKSKHFQGSVPATAPKRGLYHNRCVENNVWRAYGQSVCAGIMVRDPERLEHKHVRIGSSAAYSEAFHLSANKPVLIKSNNTTVVQIINNRGCTKSSHLCIKVWDLWNLAIQHNMYLKAVHICGKTNILADQPSRKKIRATEWTFKQGSCAEYLSHLWDSIDGSVCVSPKPSDANFLHMVSEQIGLCSRCSWENMFAYAFPPLCLIPKVLKHFSQFHCTIILIAPQWPRRHWYTEIIQYLIANFNETPCSSQCSQSATNRN